MFIVKDQGLVGLILDEVKPPRIKLLSLSHVLTESIHPSHHHSQLFFEWYGKIKTFLLDFALFYSGTMALILPWLKDIAHFVFLWLYFAQLAFV